jgi:hypothetical protein
MKLRILMIAAVVFTISQPGWTQAANLRDVRTGKHEKFTRVVFEFQDNALFENPEIKGEGEFSVVFLDSSSTLPRLILLKTGPTQLVQSIGFVQQKANLMANVRLSFPYFILKSYPLSSPNRIVIDAYPVTVPPEKTKQTPVVHKKPLTETPAAPEKKEMKNVPQKIPEKTTAIPLRTPPVAKKSELKKPQPPEKVSSKNMSQQMPEKNVSHQVTEKHAESPSFANGNAMTQIYLLVLLNVLTGAIIVLMVFTLLKKRHVTDVSRLIEIMEFIKTSDESMETLDAQLKTAFKEYDES